MRGKKTSKKMIIIFSVVLCVAVIALVLWYINVNWWVIRPADEIESIDIRLTLKSGYKDMTITDKAEIEHIRNMVADVQNEFNIGDAKIHDANFEADVPISLFFYYNDGRRQEFLVLKKGAIGFMGPDYRWKYISMDNVNTNELYNYFSEDFA